MEHNAKLAIVLLLSILIIPLSLADYNQLPTAGNDDTNSYQFRGTGSTTQYTKITSVGSGTGSFTSPIVFDANNDGRQEIFVFGGNDIINVLSGDSVDVEQASLEIGEPFMSPVACDIDADGKKEYVGVFNNGTGDYLRYINFDANSAISLGDSYEVPNSVLRGKMVCADFFSSEGDNANHVFFLDEDKYLYYAKVAGGSWSVTQTDSDGSVSHETGASFTHGDMDIALMEETGLGVPVIVWVSGTYIHGFTPDGDGFSENFNSELVLTPTSNNRIFVGVRESPNGVDKVVLVTSAVGTNAASGFDILLYKTGSIFKTWSLDESEDFNPGGSLTRNHHASTMISAYDNDAGTEDVIIRYEIELKQGSDGVGVVVLSGTDLSVLNSSSSTAQCTSSTARSYPNHAYYVDMNGDGRRDIVSTCVDGGGNDIIYYLSGDSFTTKTVFHNNTATNTKISPYPVNYNNDNHVDFIVSHASLTYFLQSSIVSTTAQNYPFSVELANTTEELEAFMDITGLYENEDALFNYALVCSVQSNNIWNEDFGLQYQFNDTGVSLNVFPPEDLLTFDGIEHVLDGVNFTQFDLQKEHTEGVRDYMILGFGFTEPLNRTYDLIGFGSDTRITEYWRLNKTGSNLTITKVVPFVGETVVGSASVGAQVLIEFEHEPTSDGFTGQKYFNIDILVNNVTVVSDNSNIQFSGSDLKKVEVFTDTPGSLSIQLLRLVETSDLEPGFTQFQNGVQITSGGFTTTVPSPAGSSIASEGFIVYPGFNDEFSSSCEYDSVGTYRQRHYIAPPNTGFDYSNYKEILVTVSGVATVGGGFGEGALSSDPLVNKFRSFLDGFGFGSTFGVLLVWTLIVLALMIWASTYNVVAGVAVLILGIIIGGIAGVYPVWFLLLLALVGVAAAVMLGRKVFVGD